MWSGPRSLSTAMMRAFENRVDTAVWDEPLYAHYLAHTGLVHPLGSEVIAAGETDWREVVRRCGGEAPGGKRLFFQKHMTHHLLPHVERSWMRGVRHFLLLRDPRAILASYVRSRSTVTLGEIGVTELATLHDALVELSGQAPPIVTCDDVRRAPRAVLSALCRALDVPFSEAMLSWSPGPRESDGVWAPHWYHSVLKSTGFAPPVPPPDGLPEPLETLAEQAYPYYARLHALRLRPAEGEEPCSPTSYSSS